MLRIGDFSKLSRITIRMLRHYDEIGLLKPEKVDQTTGYRYYEESQLLQAQRIAVLKNMGFGLPVIQEIMDQYSDADALERFLNIKKQEILEEGLALKQKLHLIDRTIEWLRKDGTIMGYDVNLKTMPERYVASVRQVIPAYNAEGMLWKIMMEETKPFGIQEAVPSYEAAVFCDGEYKEREVEVEVQKAVTGAYKDTEYVKFKTVPSMQIASATYKGGYEQLSQVNGAVATWINDNGYEFDGPYFNIYHVGYKSTQNPDEFVTEVCYPVRKKP